jgi:hypothetical protein
MTQRRFPSPWTVEDIVAAFVVKDSSGQKLAYEGGGSLPRRIDGYAVCFFAQGNLGKNAVMENLV